MWSLNANRSMRPSDSHCADFGLGIEIVGLVAQVEAGVRRELRPHRLDRLEQLPRIVAAAQARLPRPGRGVKDRGDAVGDRLPVAVDQRHVDREIDAGARHHLPLEGIAMQVDDARQHQQAAGIEAERAAAVVANRPRRSRGRRSAARFRRISLAEQRPAAFDQNVGHDAALLLAGVATAELAAASYFARKSSIASLRKSGRARRSVSWSQSHHASSASRSAMASGNRRLIDRAGLPADDGVGRHVLGDDGAGRDHGAGADAAARQHDRAMPDPDVMADMDVMRAPPFEELGVVALARKIGAGAIGEVRLRRAVHRMIAGIDPRHRRDRAELSDRGVGDLRVVHDVGIVVHRRRRAGWCGRRPRNRRRAWLSCSFARGIDRRFDGKHLAGHAASPAIGRFESSAHVIDGA